MIEPSKPDAPPSCTFSHDDGAPDLRQVRWGASFAPRAPAAWHPHCDFLIVRAFLGLRGAFRPVPTAAVAPLGLRCF